MSVIIPANVPFSKLYDQVLPYLPGAETPIVDSQIRKAVREFMRRTTLIRETFQWYTQFPSLPTYKLLPGYGEVSSTIGVWIDEDLKPLPVATEDRRPPREPGKPVGWFSTVLDYINLYPEPDAEYLITCSSVVTLRQDAVSFPEVIFDHHAEAIAAGVISAMCSMPGKPWTQPTAAQQAGRMFAGEIRTLRGSLRDGGQPNQSTFTAARKFGV